MLIAGTGVIFCSLFEGAAGTLSAARNSYEVAGVLGITTLCSLPNRETS